MRKTSRYILAGTIARGASADLPTSQYSLSRLGIMKGEESDAATPAREGQGPSSAFRESSFRLSCLLLACLLTGAVATKLAIQVGRDPAPPPPPPPPQMPARC